MQTLKIVADRNIPYLRDAIDGLGEAVYLPGNEIGPEEVKDADILLTRTRTKCNSALLDGSSCSFIGTTTIGTDHIDLGYCASHGITVANAPGCNAPAVAQYVLSAVSKGLKSGEKLSDKTLGIIGVGNVGKILARWARGLGMRVLLNDPPRAESEGEDGFVSLDEIARECDVISVHVPYTTGGKYPTFHLINDDFLRGTERRPMIVNAARGEVADTAALKSALRSGKVSSVAIDCWEGEPKIDTGLLSMALVATPHIAGYSAEGKIRATRMILEALARHLSIPAEKLISKLPATAPIPDTITPSMLDYDIEADTQALKNSPSPSSIFESLRNNYPLRPEPHKHI